METANIVGIFWDYENCAPSSNGSGYHLIDRIRHISLRFGSVNLFKAYLQFPTDKSSSKLNAVRSDLQACGVSLTDCPHNGKNSVDLMMIVDIMAFIKDNRAPATIILISGDRDFAYLLATVRWRQYNVVLISNIAMTNECLINQANITFDWQADVLKVQPVSDASRAGSHKVKCDTSVSTSDRHPVSGSVGHIQSTHPVNFTAESHSRLDNPPLVVVDQPAQSSPLTPPRNADFVSSVASTSSELSQSPVNVDAVDLEDISRVHNGISQLDDWVLTDYSPVPQDESLATTISADEMPLSSVFTSPTFVPSELEGDIPTSPGYLLLLGETDDSAKSTPVDVPEAEDGQVAEASAQEDAKPKQSCDCKICLRSATQMKSLRSLAEGVAHVEATPTIESEPVPSATFPQTPQPSHTPLTLDNYNIVPTCSSPCENPSASTQKPDFKDLTFILNDLRSKGTSNPRSSRVEPILRVRKPDIFNSAGVPHFQGYLQLAEAMGIILLEHGDEDPRVWLRSAFHEGEPASCSPVIKAGSFPQGLPPPAFRDLIFVLNELRMGNIVEARFAAVIPKLLKRNAEVYQLAGTTRFKSYVDAAVKAGVITLKNYGNGDGWIILCERWVSQPDHQNPRPQPEPCQPNPNQSRSNKPSASAFQPLVDVLEDLRSKGYPQSRVSDIFARFSWDQRNIYDLADTKTFTDYMNAAVSAGIITIEGGHASSANTWVCLRSSTAAAAAAESSNESKVMAPSTSDPMAADISPSSASMFEDLIRTLEELRWTNITEIRFSELGALVLARNPQALKRAGASTIGEYIRFAVHLGVVISRDVDGDEDGWVELHSHQLMQQRQVNTPPSTQSPSLVNSGDTPAGGDFQACAAFSDLVLVLQQLRASGESESRFSSVIPLLLKRKPNAYQFAGVTKFKDYIERAAFLGIVSVRDMKKGDGWISLLETRPGNKRGRSNDSNEIPVEYRELVWLLRQLRRDGDLNPLFSVVATVFWKNDRIRIKSWGAVGALRFKQYVESASAAGIITLKNQHLVGAEQMSLCPAWEAGEFIPFEQW